MCCRLGFFLQFYKQAWMDYVTAEIEEKIRRYRKFGSRVKNNGNVAQLVRAQHS